VTWTLPPLGLIGSATHRHRILLPFEQHARLTGLRPRLGERHVRVVAEREPALAACECVAHGPRGTPVSGLLAEV
jgi:hypothetical protein